MVSNSKDQETSAVSWRWLSAFVNATQHPNIVQRGYNEYFAFIFELPN